MTNNVETITIKDEKNIKLNTIHTYLEKFVEISNHCKICGEELCDYEKNICLFCKKGTNSAKKTLCKVECRHVEKCWRKMLAKNVGENLCRKMLAKNCVIYCHVENLCRK